MSKISIVITIEPDADGVRCGECKMMRYLINCPFMDEHSVSTCLRGPACIAAQARYTRMVEALRMVIEDWDEMSLGCEDTVSDIRYLLREEEG